VLFGVSTPLASRLVGDLDTLMLAGLLYVSAGLAVRPSCVRRPPSAAALGRSWRPLALAVIAGGALGPAQQGSHALVGGAGYNVGSEAAQEVRRCVAPD
jgi:hypothetical protein